MANEYVQLATLKATLGLTGTQYDGDLQAAIDAAGDMIDNATGRTGKGFMKDAGSSVSRKFWPLNPGFCVIDDLVALSSVDYLGDPWTQEVDFYLEPMNAAADGRPYTAIRTIARPFIYTLAERAAGWAGFDGRIEVIGQWGWPAVPAAVVEAATILASRLFRRAREAPFAVVGAGVDGEAIRLGKMDPDVAALIAPYEFSVIS